MIRLYDLVDQRDKGIQIQGIKTSADGVTFKEDLITFHHIDGMYSYCTTENGSVVHLSVSTPLKKIHDTLYELTDENESPTENQTGTQNAVKRRKKGKDGQGTVSV